VGFDAAEICVTFGVMGRWTIPPSRLFVLVNLLSLIVLILVLPQVDLPDTAFHAGTAPGDVHSRVTSAFGLSSVGTAVPINFAASQAASCRREHSSVFAHATSSFLPLLHRSLRC
jgi:hypothetical protein